MAGKICITLPLPPRQLSPNCPGASRWKSSYVKAYREATVTELHIAIRDQAIDIDCLPWTRAESQDTFYWPTRRRRDVRNAEGSLKAAYDALVRGGLLTDDDIKHLTHRPTLFRFDKINPRVQITVYEC